jgi:HD-like signal output (HDOD) protein
MIHFIRRLFGRETLPLQVPAAEPAEGLRAAAKPQPAVPAPIQAAGPEPFDAIWKRLNGTDQAPVPALEPEAREMADYLAPRVRGIFTQIRPDPASFPALALQILDLVNAPDLDLNQLIRTISPDPAISLHVLRAANSAHYGRGAEIQDLRRAVLQLGTREVGVIAAGVASKCLFDPLVKAEYEIFGQRWNTMFRNTMAVALGASQFAFEQQVGRADHAFLVGMFHDIGKTLALRSLARLVLNGEVTPPLPDPVVDAVLEEVHLEIGCELHRIWGLPEYLTQVCGHHHDPEVPAGLEHLDVHILRLVEGLHRLVLDPGDLDRLDETRQSLHAMGLTQRNAQRIWRDLGVHQERVLELFPG